MVLGLSDTPEEAARVRDAALKDLGFASLARLNMEETRC
jgi:hypothetical protein